MIVIYTEDNDITSNLDIDWISALYSGEIKRVNTDYFAMPKDEDYHIDINESIPVKSIWYRRPGRKPLPIRMIPESLFSEKNNNSNLESRLIQSGNRELENINSYDITYKYKAETVLGDSPVTI